MRGVLIKEEPALLRSRVMMGNSFTDLDFLIVLGITGFPMSRGQVMVLSQKQVYSVISCYIYGCLGHGSGILGPAHKER